MTPRNWLLKPSKARERIENMPVASEKNFQLPPEQQAIRDRCFHPSGTFVEFPSEEIEQSIPARFEKIVRLYPERLAVKMGDRALTYDELNQAANRIARGILDSQGPRQEPVVVLFEQGVEAIAATLGVLKAGKFYVPVNPSFPNARIAAIVDDAQSSLLITDNKNIAAARKITKNLLNIDEIDATVANDNLGRPLSPDNLAYIIYTSGTTGKPKGVFQNQRNVLQWTLGHSNAIHICAADRLALMHSHSTSGGAHRMYDALLNGAAVFPFDFRADGVKLAAWILDERITIYQSGPLVFRQWVDALNGHEPFPNLRLIRLSGMAMNAEDVVRYRSHFSADCLLVHVLGTSEGGTIPYYFIDKSSELSESPVPVGYSLGDSKVLVVDESGHRAEAGVVGEITIQSRYLACGYWRNAELTDEKFLPDPQGGEDWLYRTGDLGRMTADGCLYHLGRKDLRVKIRGYSIEISEIESTLREHPAIKAVVVISTGDAKGEPQLVAHLVPATMTGLTVSALRNYLLDRLPEYMVPSIFVSLPAMPLTSNGKIDRKALSVPPATRPALDTAYAAPRTPLEHELKNIWSEVLGLDDIGVYDNFFDLGGHSLRAVQVLSRIRQSCQIEVSLQNFFAMPSLAALAEYIENRPQSFSRTEISPLQRISRGDPLPLSFAQQRLWVLDQLEPASVRYNVALALLFTGPLDVEILRQCLNEIVRRHESLRTVITVVDGRPCQTLVPFINLELPVIDLSQSISQAMLDSAIQQFITGEAHQPFDLGRGPLIRSNLLSLKTDRHVLLLTLNHIAFDGWSGGIVRREIASLYADFLHGKAASLPDLRIQYSDYAAWQRRSLQGAVLEDLLAYWKKQLANLSRLQLPTDRPRSKTPSCRGAREFFSLTATTSDLLKALARQENATLFMVLLAAFQSLLHRYTGQTDIVTGTPVAGRSHAEIENLIGFFLNMLVLRADLSGNPTFRQLLSRTRQTCIDAYVHEGLPFEMLVEELKPERIINQNPLFQVTFVLQNFPKVPFESSGITAVEMDIDPGIARFDLHCFMTEEKNRLEGYFEYNTELFDGATIERMVGHFQTLLDGIAADPDRAISELPVLMPAERRRLLVEWNDTKANYPKAKCLHQLFEEQVERSPDAIALVYEDQQVTYGGLNRRANQLAHYLRKQGVGPEVLVGIYMERSLDLIVGLLAILKAGGAFVPLEQTYPKDRLAFMLEDAQPKVLLTQACLRDELPKSAQVLCLDAEWEVLAYESADSPSNESVPSDPAYLIYTSGSTGKPKGVMIAHSAIVNHMHWMQNTFRFSETDAIVQKTPISFDASVWEIFAPLLAGSRLIVAQPHGHRDSAYLCRLIQEQGATVLQLVPAMLRVMLQDVAFIACPTLRVVFCGGEVLPVDLAQTFHARFGSRASLWNLYGPTEASIDATYWQCKRDGEEAIVPIGRPIANAQIYILDVYRNPVPIGVVGEIYIGGAGVARGYLNRPELTAERFVYHSFDGEPAQRLYRTGDFARYLPDRNIEFLGRADNQVKIRGYRIELGEIETLLAQHPSIRAAVVITKDDPTEDKQLIAYIVLRESAPEISELRAYLKAKLPDFMVPSAFVILESLPLTPNGKVDRQALPEPDRAAEDLPGYVGPRNIVEEIIVSVWSEVLGTRQIGIHDNFFDLGGHSLKATQVVSRLRMVFGSEIPLRHLFEFPTIAEFVAVIDSKTIEELNSDILKRMSEIEALSEKEAQRLLAPEIESENREN